ncbi:MAG: FAD-dependent oxidoreductase [Anaerovoracaceae bacterium]
MKGTVVIIGGGWSGVAGAVRAAHAGARVILAERTDLLLGLGNVGGIMRNNGRFVATEENIAMGADELFGITDRLARHTGIDFPGHRHASLYNVILVEPAVRRLLQEMGVELRLMCRITDVDWEEGPEGKVIRRVISADGEELAGDVFLDTTGSTGPMGNCLTYGNGCAMCILRCAAFGPRMSVTRKLGLEDLMGQREDGSYGAFSGACKLEKNSLSPEIVRILDTEGVAVIPLDREQIHREKLNMKVCQQYALDEYAENIILLDTGYAKLMTPFFPLHQLRSVPGFENARYVDPYAGGKGNSIRYLSVAERRDDMSVIGAANLFCGGEKSGLFVGHTEAITTGSLAGYNAVRRILGLPGETLPQGLATGDLIAFANRQMKRKEGMMTRYTFAGAEYFERMKQKGLYTTDVEKIRKRVKECGVEGMYKEKLL